MSSSDEANWLQVSWQTRVGGVSAVQPDSYEASENWEQKTVCCHWTVTFWARGGVARETVWILSE